MILLIDNFDSFVYNLARYFQELGVETRVVRNNETTPAEIRASAPQAIVLSPGPCDPPKAGICLEVVRQLGGEFPILGVCLGHQTIAAAYGGDVRRGRPRHGRTSEIHHSGDEIFQGVPSPFTAARYHSLVVAAEGLPSRLRVTATVDDGTIMAIRHSELSVFGIQFHPESVLTQHGHRILQNFLVLARSLGGASKVA